LTALTARAISPPVPPPFDIAQAIQEAVALHRQNRLREAEKIYARVLKANPNTFDALNLLGALKAQTGQMGEALRLISAAVKINPRAGDALVNLANVFHALKRDADALDCLDKALALDPNDLQALANRGSALLTLNRPQEALDCCERVLQRAPGHGEALLNRGVARAALGRHAEALADFDAAFKVAPAHPQIHYNRGNALLQLGRPAEALAAFDRTLAALPEHAGALNNRGNALRALNRNAEAAASFGKLLTLQKNNADAHFNLAMALLTDGDLRRGFEHYEYRWTRTGMTDTRRGYRGPLWLGDYPLGNKRILLHAEQGLGDTIQFARYAPLLARGGARVILEAPPTLKTLLSGLPGIVSCHARGEPLPPYDVHCPLGSLPLAMKTDAGNVPADIPYLHAGNDALAKWRPVIEALPGKRVALAWAGQPAHANDRNRSMDLKLLEPLFAVEGVSFVSVQRDLRDGDAAVLARHQNVRDVGDRLADMSDSAAVVALTDLTISVDTSVAHLAGSLGRPLWVLLPFAPDWRWTLTGDHSPWYPQARLLRQPSVDDWASVVASLRDALAGLAKS